MARDADFGREAHPRETFHRIVREAKLWVSALVHPPSPRHCLAISRDLARSHGWVAPMLMLAGAGVLGPLNILAGQLGRPWIARGFFILTFVAWIAIGAIATVGIAGISLRNLSRFGLLGFARPRFWFEGARLAWIVFQFSAFSLALVFIISRGTVGPKVLEFTGIFLPLVACSFPAFLLLATIGYGLSFARRLPRMGRAFECVHFFYVTIGGVGLLGIAAALCPARAFWPDGFYIAALGSCGIAILSFGMVSIDRRYAAFERQKR